MFVILIALALLVPNVADQEPQSSVLKSALEGLKNLSKKFEWRENLQLASKAFEWITKNISIRADMTYRGRRCFRKVGNGTREDNFNKIISNFTPPFNNQRKSFITRYGGTYGCNGFDRGNCIYVGCLFKRLVGHRHH